jgi:ribosome-associated protein
VICSGMSRQQLHAIGRHVEEVLRTKGYSAYKVDGYTTSTWVVLDYGDVVVHIFSAERLWGDARAVAWSHAIHK